MKVLSSDFRLEYMKTQPDFTGRNHAEEVYARVKAACLEIESDESHSSYVVEVPRRFFAALFHNTFIMATFAKSQLGGVHLAMSLDDSFHLLVSESSVEHHEFIRDRMAKFVESPDFNARMKHFFTGELA